MRRQNEDEVPLDHPCRLMEPIHFNTLLVEMEADKADMMSSKAAHNLSISQQ
jgi:hypothetical protein